MKRKGILFVISAASGTGKTSVCRRLVDILPELRHSVSFTTRPMREGEIDGVDYHFVSPEAFRAMIDCHELAEWAEVHGNYYGTGLQALEQAREAGKDLLLDIDIQGAHQIQQNVADAVLIFLLPPSLDSLKQRLEGRGLDAPAVIRQRLENARAEIPAAQWYDYCVINHDLGLAVEEVVAILRAEACRVDRKLDKIKNYYGL